MTGSTSHRAFPAESYEAVWRRYVRPSRRRNCRAFSRGHTILGAMRKVPWRSQIAKGAAGGCSLSSRCRESIFVIECLSRSKRCKFHRVPT